MLLQLVYKVEHKLLNTRVVLLTVYKFPGMLLQLVYRVEHKLLNIRVVLLTENVGGGRDTDEVERGTFWQGPIHRCEIHNQRWRELVLGQPEKGSRHCSQAALFGSGQFA